MKIKRLQVLHFYFVYRRTISEIPIYVTSKENIDIAMHSDCIYLILFVLCMKYLVPTTVLFSYYVYMLQPLEIDIFMRNPFN